MNALRLATRFRSKGIAKGWFVLLFSVYFGILVTVLSRIALFLVDRFVFEESSNAFRLSSVLISLVFSIGLGIYIANRAWKPEPITKHDQDI